MTSPLTNSLDIYARSFTSAGAGSGSTVAPREYPSLRRSIRAAHQLVGNGLFDRVDEPGAGRFARRGLWAISARGTARKSAANFVSTPQRSIRKCSRWWPRMASSQFLVIWSSFTGLPYGFDLFAQRYVNSQQPLEPMAAPFVYAPFVVSNGVYQPQLLVSWPPVTGLSVSNYEVYVNGATTPTALTTSNVWTMTAANGLTASSSNYFQVDYVTTDGRRSPLSPPAGGTTWSGDNYYGIPFEWMEKYYGYNFANWPANVNAPLASGWGEPASSILERRQSARFQHVAAERLGQHAGRLVSQLEHPAGLHLSGADVDELWGLEQCGRAAFRGGRQ